VNRKRTRTFLILAIILIAYLIKDYYNQTGILIYFIITTIIVLSAFTKYTLIRDLGLNFKVFKNKRFYYFLIPSIFISNLIIYLIKDFDIVSTNYDYQESILKTILIFLFVKSIRIFGEEILFRGILLIPEFKNSKNLFWRINIIQAVIFTTIHILFVEGLMNKLIFGLYALLISIYFGWLNRKFDSIIPSSIIHWMNGIQVILITQLMI